MASSPGLFAVITDIHSASNLRPVKKGSANPYVACYVVSNSKKTIKSPVIANTLNPVWQSRWHVNATPNDVLILEVWHKKKHGKEFLGITSLDAAVITNAPQTMILKLNPRTDKDKEITGELKVSVSKTSEIVVLKSSGTKNEKHVIVPLLRGEFDPILAELSPRCAAIVSRDGLLHARYAILRHFGALKGTALGNVIERNRRNPGKKVRESVRAYKFERGNMTVGCTWINDELEGFGFFVPGKNKHLLYTQPAPSSLFADFAQRTLQDAANGKPDLNTFVESTSALKALAPLSNMKFYHKYKQDDMVVPALFGKQGYCVTIKLRAKGEKGDAIRVIVSVITKPVHMLVNSIECTPSK